MKAKLFRLLAPFVVGLSCTSSILAGVTHLSEPAAHGTDAPPDVEKPNWRTFTSAEGRFSLKVATTPISKTRILHADGAALHQFFCRMNGEIYIFQYIDKPAAITKRLGAEKMLTINDAALLKISKGTLVSKRRIMLDGHPGHEIVLLEPSGWKQTQRAYLVSNRAYIIGVVQPQVNSVTEAADAGKFFNSFTLLSAKTPSRNP